MSLTVRERVVLAAAFIDAALRYWLTVFPRVGGGLRHYRRRAGEIPDPELRRIALDSLRKRGNIEGAAAFAAFAPRARRGAVVRALVAFQVAYNYLDLLSEQPHKQAITNGRRLHEALRVALDPDAPHLEYYAHHPRHDDGGYLEETIDACRTALRALPAYELVARSTQSAARRIVTFQSLNVGSSQGDHDELARWAREETPAATGLRWWETAAAAGSSLGVHALIAAAADSGLQQADTAAIDDAYFPWIGALHSLLDNLVDRHEDALTDQRSLIGYYASPAEAGARLRTLAVRATSRARALPRGRRHAVILAAMVGNYLSTPQANEPDVEAVSRGVLDTIGALASPTLLVFKLRRLGGRATEPVTAEQGSAVAAGNGTRRRTMPSAEPNSLR